MTSKKDLNSKISWSKNGFVAYSDLSPSTNLSITKLETIKGASWRISPKKTYQIKTSTASKLNELSTVQWSTPGSELALIDIVGNLTILGTGLTKSNPGSSPQLACFEEIEILYQDHITDLNQNNQRQFKSNEFFTSAIAFKWLNLDKPVISSSPAIRKDSNYVYAVHQYKSYGALHPIQMKSGFFVIRKNGQFSFYYQTMSSAIEFKKITTTLETGQNIWLDHASIGYYRDGSVILVTYEASINLLKVYKVVIDYGNPAGGKLNPVLKVDRLVNQSIPKVGSNGLSMELASLSVISPNFSNETDLDILLNFRGDGITEGKALLQKYQISNEFKNFKFQKDLGNNNVDGYPNLQLVAETSIEDEVLNITFQHFDFLIVLYTSNGEIQLRHRKSLKLHTNSPHSITSLSDIGFTFPKPDAEPEQISISPCLCGYLTLNNHQLKLYNVYKPEVSSYWTDEELKSIAGGIAYSFAYACFTNVAADELIITVQNELSKIADFQVREKAVMKILEESHKALNFSLDHSKDHIDKLLVNPPIQRLLGFQYSLGKYVSTNEQSSIALGILNLRLVSFSIMLSMRTLFHQQQRISRKGNFESLSDSIYRSENLLSTIGPINWFIEFMIFAVQEFIELTSNSEHKTIILALCLSKIPRSLMIYSIAGIKRSEGLMGNKLEELSKTNNMNNALQYELLNASYIRLKYLLGLMSLDLFEKFLNQIESIFTRTSSDPVTGLKIEQELIFQNTVPDVYKPAMSQLMNKFQEMFQELDLSTLYFHDTKWLNFQIKTIESPKKVLLSPTDKIPISINLKEEIIDDVSKIKIINKNKLKKCVRCEYVTSENNSEDFNMILKDQLGSPMNQYWPFAFNRTCLCGSCWAYINEDEIAP